VNASNPPAEAPMPTTGKWFGLLPFSPRVSGCTLSPGSWVRLADIEREDVECFSPFDSDAFLSVVSLLETFLRVFDFIEIASLVEGSGFPRPTLGHLAALRYEGLPVANCTSPPLSPSAAEISALFLCLTSHTSSHHTTTMPYDKAVMIDV
jgi:hypothetical protein